MHMPQGRQSKGTCAYCGYKTTKGSMVKHLVTCPQRQEILSNAEHKKTSHEILYHLRVKDAWGSEFWLDLEMRASATLKDLDYYLRAIWLECCDHMSRVSIGGWQGKEIAKKRRADEVFQAGSELTHIYDFGTSSETRIKVMGQREGTPTSRWPMALMARNVMPEAMCIECRKPAGWLFIECLIEEDVWGTLCDTHAETHPHNNYDEQMPLVNSPRLEMCGYTGPADPPH
jgi:hypothetical protein